MSNFSSLAGPGITNVQSTQDQYRLNGEMPPDIATQEQALNRRQQIANLLIQRGMQGAPGGQMVGRFFVKSSPYQNLASLGEILAGTLGTHVNEQGHKDLAAQQKEMTANAVQDFIRSRQPVPEVAPNAPTATPMEGAAQPEAPSQGNPYFAQAAGANPGVGQFPQTSMAPTDGPVFAGPQGQGYQMQPDPEAAPPQAQPPAPSPMQGPITPGTPARPRSQAEITEALAKAYTSQIPGLKEFAALQMQQEAQAQERASQRGFLEQEAGMNREVRREGIASNAELRKSQIESNMLNTQAIIDSKERQGQDANDLKRTLAEQQNELKKMEIESRHEALQQGKVTPGYRQLPDGSWEPIKGGPADQKTQLKAAGQETVSNVVASLRDQYNQLQKSGGITDTTKGALGNILPGIESSGVGQTTGKLFGTQNQSLRNTIAQQRPLLLQAIMKATGMSAKQMDSNTELKLYLSTATDPTLDVQSNMRALDMIERLYGGGSETAGSAANPASAQPIYPTATGPGGKKMIFKEGQWQPQ